MLFRGSLGRVMVLGSFQFRGVLLLRHMEGQGPAVLAAVAGWVSYVLFYFIFIYLFIYFYLFIFLFIYIIYIYIVYHIFLF